MSKASQVDVLINSNAFPGVNVDILHKAAERALAQGAPRRGEMSVTLLGDHEIIELNRQYLGRDRVTDVIAFSLGGDDVILGDVYVGVEQARRQALDAGITELEELVRLVIHGTLHVLGFDHPEGEDRLGSPMFATQEQLVVEVLSDA